MNPVECRSRQALIIALAVVDLFRTEFSIIVFLRMVGRGAEIATMAASREDREVHPHTQPTELRIGVSKSSQAGSRAELRPKTNLIQSFTLPAKSLLFIVTRSQLHFFLSRRK